MEGSPSLSQGQDPLWHPWFSAQVDVHQSTSASRQYLQQMVQIRDDHIRSSRNLFAYSNSEVSCLGWWDGGPCGTRVRRGVDLQKRSDPRDPEEWMSEGIHLDAEAEYQEPDRAGIGFWLCFWPSQVIQHPLASASHLQNELIVTRKGSLRGLNTMMYGKCIAPSRQQQPSNC